MRILIIGSGIGGLTAAMCLHQAGHDVQVYEAVPEIKPLGVGINVLPHAMKVLDGLGLTDNLLSIGVATQELAYYNKIGQRIWGEPRGKAAGYAWPQISIHRGSLQMALLDAARAMLGPERILLGHRLTAIADQAAGKVLIERADGTSFTAGGDIIVGADGIHSIIRRGFFPDEGLPVFSGRMLWRGRSRAKPYLTGASMIMAGHQDQKFVAYPIEPDRGDGQCTVNWIAELKWPAMLERENWNRTGELKDFLPQFEAWRFDWLDVPGLIRDADAIYEFPMVDRDPLPRWRHGVVTLLGDAAHPMYPIGSNGASQAILDAQALTDCLGQQNDAVAALTAYEAQRLPATAAIVLANRSNGPEQCMQIAEERAPQGFSDIETVIPRAELEAIAARYKAVAGFSVSALNDGRR